MTTLVRVTPQDVINRKVHIRFSGATKVALLEAAGAPWNEADPTATLSPIQREILHRKEREKYINGGSRLGKSVLGGGEGALDLLLMFTHQAVVGMEYIHVGREWQYVDKALKGWFGDIPAAFVSYHYTSRANYHVYDAEMAWGAKAVGYSLNAKEGGAAMGTQFTRIICGEGAYVPLNIYERRLARATDGSLMKRADGLPIHESGYLSCYTTPMPDAQGFDASVTAQVKKDSLRISHGTSENVFTYGAVPFAESKYVREADVLENPAYDKRVYEARRKTMSPDAFAEVYQGRRTFRSGLVYKHFGPHLVIPQPEPELIRSMTLGIGIDTGTFYAASLFGRSNDKGYGLGEVYLSQENVSNFCEEIKQMIVDVLGPVFSVSGSLERAYRQLKDQIDLWVVDPASQVKVDLMDYLDITLAHPMHESGGKFFWHPTRDELDAQFEHEQCFMSEDMIHHVDQFGKYRWGKVKSVKPGGGEIVRVPAEGQADHTCDSFRFIAVTMCGTGAREDAPVAETHEQAWARQQREVTIGRLQGILADAEEQGGVWTS